MSIGSLVDIRVVKVNLFHKEILECEKWAEMRVSERISAGAYNSDEFDKNFKAHRSGCLGEFAVCKHYDCEWTGRYYEGDSWKNRDWDTEVGEVRATFHPDLDGGMRIYHSDKYPEAPFIWVILSQRGKAIVQAEIVGWFYRDDARKPEWWNEDTCMAKGYWVVPRELLKPIDELPTVVSDG